MSEPAELRKPSLAGVHEAAQKIAAILPPTPLLPLEINGAKCWAKAEGLQPIGAFKIRGAWHRLTALSPHQQARSVVAVSSGNHAQGVAWAANKLGIEATIVMPADAPPIKLARTRELGAQIITYDRMNEDREAIAAAIARACGATLVHPFADPWIIEGQGSAGIEIAAQLAAQGASRPDRIIACCGGGGLSAGLALACPDAQIVTVEPEGWDDVARSLATGKIQSVNANPPATKCDALQTFATQPLNFAILKDRCAPGLAVSEKEVRAAQRHAFARLGLVLEPGGAAALAAALSGKAALDGTSVIMLSGSNVDPDAFAQVIASDD